MGLAATTCNTGAARSYSCAASPYWAAKGFTPLLLSPQHAFWTAPEAPLPAEKPGGFVHAMPPPGLLTRLAEASRKGQGCLRFDVLQHTMRANHFTVIEIWENQKALDAHAAARHTKQYRDGLQPISGSPLDERLYKRVE